MVNTEAAVSGAQEGGRGLPYPFLETRKTVLVLQNRCSNLGKTVLFAYRYGLNSRSKCSFNSILEKNTYIFPSFLYIVHETFMEVSLLRETPCSKKFLVVRLEVYCKKGILKKFANFTGKDLRQSLFLNKVTD